MDNDHVKRFRLSEKQPHRDFDQRADAPTVKTKDNAQPVIPPPRTVFIPHPQLAPPGMMGSRLAADAAKWRERAAETRSEFRPFAPKPRIRGQFRMEDIPSTPLVRTREGRELER